jgi:hypothetical protein
MSQKSLLTLDRSLPQFCKLGPLANCIEQRILVQGGIRTIPPLDRLAQLPERRVRLPGKAEDLGVLAMLSGRNFRATKYKGDWRLPINKDGYLMTAFSGDYSLHLL